MYTHATEMLTAAASGVRGQTGGAWRHRLRRCPLKTADRLALPSVPTRHPFLGRVHDREQAL
jgi:hypothetical protein